MFQMSLDANYTFYILIVIKRVIKRVEGSPSSNCHLAVAAQRSRICAE